MRAIPVVSSALVVVGLAAGASAQTQEPAAPAAPAASASTEQYGLNLARIQRGLRKSAERQDYDGLNLRYYVNVYAPAPSIKLFTPLDNLLYGPAPYGGPTHRDMMNVMTPQEFRAPVADFSGIARWLANKAKK
ncbi:MAG TPA: hypothetical protein VGQ37_03355 [Vicinamibacterales bacterium]|jgi:hypothetical protein|nr:hypothetical protein [Vicinamibacterales bacterium]